MAISGRWRTNTLRTLKPSHRYWIESMKISENFSFGSSSSKDDDFRTSQNGRMCISWGRWSSRNFGFGELICIDIKNVSIIEVSITFGLTCKIMTTKDNDGCSGKCSTMPTSGTWTDTLDDGICPLPSSHLQLPIREFTRLLRVLALAFLFSFMALGVTVLTIL